MMQFEFGIGASLLFISLVVGQSTPSDSVQSPGSASAVAVAVGKPAPQLSVQTLLNAPDGSSATWASLRGKVVVLEFWATWCAPCVRAIPHMNELHEKFADKPIVFISITDEAEAKVSEFLKTRPIRGWVALDPTKATHQAFGVTGIPRTILIDAEGVVRRDFSPNELTEAHIETLLTGKPLLNNDQAMGIRRRGSPSTAPSLDPDAENGIISIDLRRSEMDGKSRSDVETVEIRGLPSGILIQRLWNVSAEQMDVRCELPTGYYSLTVKSPGRAFTSNELMRATVEHGLGLRVRRETCDVKVLVVTVEEGGCRFEPSAVNDSKRTLRSDRGGKVEFENFTAGALVNKMSRELGSHIVDESKHVIRYDGQLTWDDGDRASLLEALRKMGILISDQMRPVEFLVVEKRD